VAKISVSNLTPGMKLSKPVVNEANMILFGEGTVLTGAHIERLHNMNINSVHVEGDSKPKKPKEEVLAELEARFKKTENEPYMGTLKKLFVDHIEELYK